MPGQGEILSSETPDTLCIPCKNKWKKDPDTSIIRKRPTKEPVHQNKKGKRKYFNWCRKSSPKETHSTFRHKVDYEGDINENTYGSDYSPSETGGCKINLAK